MSIYTEQRAPRLVSQLRRYFPNVDRVADANKPMKVVVSADDVKKARKMEHNACAMAKACERIPQVDGAIVKTTTAYVIKGDLAIRYLLPATVTREIVSFDRNHDFRPGEYQLSAMNKAHRIDNKRGGGNHTKPRGILKHLKPLVAKHKTEGIRGIGIKPHD
jgi:hypothetical protein